MTDPLLGQIIEALPSLLHVSPRRRSVDAVVVPARCMSSNTPSTIDKDAFQPFASSLVSL